MGTAQMRLCPPYGAARIADSNFKQPSLRALAKQSMAPQGKMDCFVASAPRNDVGTHLRHLAAQIRASFAGNVPPSTQRARGMPGAQCARSLVCEIKKHTSIVTTVTPESPGIPRAMVLTVSFALSPVTGLVCHRHQRKLPLANLTPASGRQDHTTSPSAGQRARLQRRPIP